MATCDIKLDATALKAVCDSLGERPARLGKLLEDLPPDHWARLFELPLGDLFEALTDTGMLATTEGRAGLVSVLPHPALVAYVGLLAAICDGIEAKVMTKRGEG